MALDNSEWEILRAVIDRIVPEDDFPSATGLGCDDYIRHLMELQPWLVDFYRSGLAVVSQLSFLSLDASGQDGVLRRLDGNPFLDLVVQHTMEGYYSDPGNGGNRDGLAWKMIGFEVTA